MRNVADERGEPHLDWDDALRWARWLESRLRHDDHTLPPPDLGEGQCSECGRTVGNRWTHGRFSLDLNCLRRRLRLLAATTDSAGITSAITHAGRIAVPFQGECQRCTQTAALTVEGELFLCPSCATRSRRARARRKERDEWLS